jgi:hypothetical protein
MDSACGPTGIRWRWATGAAAGADASALHECDIPVCVKVNQHGVLPEHVVAGTQFDNMRRIARARRGGGRPTIRGLGREARRARSVALARPSKAATGMPMRSPMRYSAPNLVCSEAHSVGAMFSGTHSVFVVGASPGRELVGVPARGPWAQAASRTGSPVSDSTTTPIRSRAAGGVTALAASRTWMRRVPTHW